VSISKISEYRREQGLSQEALADLAGVNLRTIQRIENGKSIPRGFTLKAIADALNKPLEEFSTGETSSVTRGGSDEGSEDDFLQAQFINLSAFSYHLSALIPFMLWRNKKHIPRVYETGRETVNFQILWTIVLHVLLLLTIAIQIFVSRYFGVQPWLTVLHVFFIMYLMNALFIVIASVRLRKGYERIYPKLIRIL
jgi:XRE family transcriptional regulator, regulator of sulfur utilization